METVTRCLRATHAQYVMCKCDLLCVHLTLLHKARVSHVCVCSKVTTKSQTGDSNPVRSGLLITQMIKCTKHLWSAYVANPQA